MTATIDDRIHRERYARERAARVEIVSAGFQTFRNAILVAMCNRIAHVDEGRDDEMAALMHEMQHALNISEAIRKEVNAPADDAA